MRIVLISDSHTFENLNFIYEYLKRKADLKPDFIVLNGDILGENEVREGYGYNYNKKIFEASINKYDILKKLTLYFENLKKVAEYHTKQRDEKLELEFSSYIMDYVKHRYDSIITVLTKFSDIAPVFFNIGTYESPLHYKVLNELAWLLDVPEHYIRSLALLSPYRDTFKDFSTKIRSINSKKIKYLGGGTAIMNDIMIAGIAGYNESSVVIDKMSEFQEKMTNDLIDSVKRQLGPVNKLILLNQTQGRLRKDPFSFRPSSLAVREFIEWLKGKLKQKVFVQSYHHFMTTHFYLASEFNFILSNSAVNNSLFNILEVGQKLNVYDVDPRLDKIRMLNPYNYNLVDYQKPEERLALNYSDSSDVIIERKLEGCYYI